MATATTEAARLAEAHRAAQARRAAAMAAIVVQYWRTRVDVQDPRSIERWLELLVPRIIAENAKSANFARTYGDRLRRLEMPDVQDGFRFPAPPALEAARVRTSLMVTGPVAVRKKLDAAQGFDFEQIKLEEPERQPLRVELPEYVMKQSMREAEKTIAGSVVRHVQNGGRHVLVEGAAKDRVALGWVRVTRANPCYFCAMLASRGLELGGIYDADSFDASDPRFVGTGTAKVHDSCHCGMKPVYTRDDEILQRTQEFERMWTEYSGGKGDPLTNFRRAYEGRA